MLILASNGYEPFKAVWRKYMHSHPQIDCYFYIGNPNMEKDAELIDDTIYVKVDDSIPYVYQKFMATLRFIQPQLENYDFLFRPNLSCFVDFKKYIEFCETLPTANVCAAMVGDFHGFKFPSGSGFTLSIDLVNRLVRENLPVYHVDDVTIGKILNMWDIPIIPVDRIDYQEGGKDLVPHEKIFHYRFKTSNRDLDAQKIDELRLKIVNPLLL